MPTPPESPSPLRRQAARIAPGAQPLPYHEELYVTRSEEEPTAQGLHGPGIGGGLRYRKWRRAARDDRRPGPHRTGRINTGEIPVCCPHDLAPQRAAARSAASARSSPPTRSPAPARCRCPSPRALAALVSVRSLRCPTIPARATGRSASAGASPCRPSRARPTRACRSISDADESDVFILSGAEDLVPVLQPDGDTVQGRHDRRRGITIHRYRPRIEGLFARIERWTRRADGDVHWRSISKDNILTLYGKDAELPHRRPRPIPGASSPG